eukprot:TRINITY_DN9004_c0_g3_i1.p5 TRINITY_DN9004_c0_g3~~TRINITY_DN9004_c0_g3_i1.p5  ORF type:complete len:144 (+),score=2.46 TRINITY_DN9004_c0_g3_i1:700-1131(+)
MFTCNLRWSFMVQKICNLKFIVSQLLILFLLLQSLFQLVYKLPTKKAIVDQSSKVGILQHSRPQKNFLQKAKKLGGFFYVLRFSKQKAWKTQITQKSVKLTFTDYRTPYQFLRAPPILDEKLSIQASLHLFTKIYFGIKNVVV